MWARLLSEIISHRCVLCNESASPPLDLCAICCGDLPQVKNPCASCALPLTDRDSRFSGKHAQCGVCMQQPPVTRYSVNYCRYAYPADFLVQQLKFAHQLHYARVMGQLLANRVAATEFIDVDVLIPIPLSLARLHERGFNQAAEIARQLAVDLNLPCRPHWLQRVGHRVPQAGLTRAQRKNNVAGVFRGSKQLENRRCVLVDDVLTTGATANEAALELYQCGAQSVDIWVFARAVT